MHMHMHMHNKTHGLVDEIIECAVFGFISRNEKINNGNSDILNKNKRKFQQKKNLKILQ